MKKIYSILLFAFIATAFISCNNDDDNNSSNLNNELLVNGKTYPLKAGALEYYGNESGNHSSGLILVTTEVNENEEAEDETQEEETGVKMSSNEDMTDCQSQDILGNFDCITFLN